MSIKKEQINKPMTENRGEIALKQAKIAVVARFPCFHAKILSTAKSEADNEPGSAPPIFQISQGFFWVP